MANRRNNYIPVRGRETLVSKTNKSNTTKNCVGCGCGPAILDPCITPPPECDNPQPCTEIINAECVIYTGPAITCNFSPVIPENSSIAEALDSLVEYLCFGRCCVIPLTQIIDMPDHIVLCTDETAECYYEGKLYNWFALNAGTPGDGRVAGGIVNITPSVNVPNTWRVPNDNDWFALALALDPTATVSPIWSNTAGGDLKTTTCWSRPNTGATNSSGMSILPGVIRQINGLFTTNNGQEAWYWTMGVTGLGGVKKYGVQYNSTMLLDFSTSSLLDRKEGLRVRLVRPVDCNSSEKDGDFIPNAYTDNNGTQYNGQVLGTLVWLTTDLTDVKYNNGLPISNIIFNAAWSAAITGAWCYPNNNISFAITYSIGCVERKIEFRDFLTFLPTASETFEVVANDGIQVDVSSVGSQTTYAITNTDTGSAQNIFKNVAVATQPTIVADTNNDTLTIVAGIGILLTTDAATDTLTITNAGALPIVLADAGTSVHESLVNDGVGPDLATKGITAGTGISLSSTATDITITSTDLGSSVTLTDVGTTTHESLVADGTGPALETKGLEAGNSITLSSTLTNIIISYSSNIGKLLGGGIVVAEWDESGVQKALVASLTDIEPTSLTPWTLPAFTTLNVGTPVVNGLINTDAIISQTGAPADITYAAGAARLHNGGGYNDWYLPSIWEMKMCYNVAIIVNRVLGSLDGFNQYGVYWTSEEDINDGSGAWTVHFDQINGGLCYLYGKASTFQFRAVRIHTL